MSENKTAPVLWIMEQAHCDVGTIPPFWPMTILFWAIFSVCVCTYVCVFVFVHIHTNII